MSDSEQRKSNRERFPEHAKFYDECVKVFGKSVRVVELEVYEEGRESKSAGPRRDERH